MSCWLHKYNTTLPFWSDLIAGQTHKWLPCFHTARRAKTKQGRQSTSKPVNTKNHVHASTQENTNMVVKKQSDVRVTGTFALTPPGWHTAVCRPGLQCVSKLRYRSHRGQRRPSCGVHSALETTSGFVCLEMRMWGGSKTPSTQNQAQELFTHSTFTGVYAVFLSHCCSSTLCMYTFPIHSAEDGIIAKEQRYSGISPTSKYWFPSVGYGFSFQ